MQPSLQRRGAQAHAARAVGSPRGRRAATDPLRGRGAVCRLRPCFCCRAARQAAENGSGEFQGRTAAAVGAAAQAAALGAEEGASQPGGCIQTEQVLNLPLLCARESSLRYAIPLSCPHLVTSLSPLVPCQQCPAGVVCPRHIHTVADPFQAGWSRPRRNSRCRPRTLMRTARGR